MKKIVSLFATWGGPAAVLVFGITLFWENVPQSISTWTSWCALDVFMALSAWRAGNRKPYLQVAYAAAALVMIAMILHNGTRQFGKTELICLIGTSIAIIVWWRLGPRFATAFGAFVMFCAGIPSMIIAVDSPDPRSWWMWLICSASGFLTLWTAGKIEIRKTESWAFAGASAIFNLVMLVLVLL